MKWDPVELRERVNRYPPYVGAGIELTHFAADSSEIRVEMKLTASNLSLAEVHFGGSLYSMVDPHLMILLINRLGAGYTVWDKTACIDFKKPGRGTVHSVIRITEKDIDIIRRETDNGGKYLPEFELEILDEDGDIVATVKKTLYVRRS